MCQSRIKLIFKGKTKTKRATKPITRTKQPQAILHNGHYTTAAQILRPLQSFRIRVTMLNSHTTRPAHRKYITSYLLVKGKLRIVFAQKRSA